MSDTSDCSSLESFVVLSAGRLFVKTWTPTKLKFKIPLVLLHDSLGCVRTWRRFPELLAQRLQRQVIAYDRSGFGRSGERRLLPSPQFIEEEARQTFPELCEALDLNSVVLLGHSVGGGMAITIAAHHANSQLCAAVITESAQAFVEDRTVMGIRAAKDNFRDPEQYAKLVKNHGSKAQWVLDAWTKVWLSPEFAGWSLDQQLPKVRCPVLAIHGDLDEFGSCDFPRRIAAGVGSYSRVEILKGFGHVPHKEDPDKVLEIVADFLDGLEDTGDRGME